MEEKSSIEVEEDEVEEEEEQLDDAAVVLELEEVKRDGLWPTIDTAVIPLYELCNGRLRLV